MTTGALLLISHEFVLMMWTGFGLTALTTYPTYRDCKSAQEYYISAGSLTQCVRLP